jgi:small subunit ribosomal protein S1
MIKLDKGTDKQDSGIMEGTLDAQIQLQEEYLKSLDVLEEGQLVTGTVVHITPDQVFVDVGYKSEGKIPLNEFEKAPVLGDEVRVVLKQKENKRGEVIVSKQEADAKIRWKAIRDAFQEHTPIEGVVARQVKGGYEVALGFEIDAFLPISQADTIRVESPEALLGNTYRFHIERLYSADRKLNIVVNRRKLLDEETEKKREEFFINVPVGTEVAGTVKSFTTFGAFVDLGGFDGLLHVNDMSWGRITRPRDMVKKGQELKLKVIRIDPEAKRINLSLKHFSDDPWIHFEEKFHVNQVVEGKVT